ncbi:PspC domain-containing protein [Flavobacterium sp. I3-2]|uniref:PspC domain-containing protein n=1 Tax=Flavobacterium sp. I3-2 TaxID=2748319 RepID=UPI0015AC6F25|nr:PspC domain-containing protein [Flavobacterium sp. I3-2]
MNKTVTINIAGLFFHIDEDAYDKLSNYLQAIKNSLNTDGKEEIINDIESRIAEIFSEKINPKTGVISMLDVDNIIQVMGQPEDYRLDDENESQSQTEQNSTNENYIKRPRKLFRDGEKRVLGGVLSGLSNYFNIDVVWIRILFILLIFVYGSSIIIYPILWIIIPKAKTVSDILEMKGEPVNISNIEKQVRENFDQIGNNIRNIDTQRFKDAGTKLSEIILKLLGIACVFIGSMGMIGSAIMIFVFNTISLAKFNNFPIEEIVKLGYPTWMILTSVFLIAFIPSLIIFITGLSCLYKNIKYVGLISILLGFTWGAAIICFSVIMIEVESKNDLIKKFIDDTSKVTVVKKSLDHITNDTLKIDFIRDPRFYGMNDSLSNGKIYKEEDDIEFEIKSTTNQDGYFEIITEASYSKSSSIVINNNSGKASITETPTMLEYYSKIDNNNIEFANAILTEKNNLDKYNNSVKIILYLPNSKIVRINKTNDISFDYNNNIQSGINFYKLIDDKLECVSCD